MSGDFLPEGVWEISENLLTLLIRTRTYLHPPHVTQRFVVPPQVAAGRAIWLMCSSTPGERVNQGSENVNRPPKCGVWLDK